jgi:uncharacterized coiled-coil protein SlyX
MSKVGLFTTLRWDQQPKLPGEKAHWLGKIVEPYFDFGQKYIYSSTLTSNQTILRKERQTSAAAKIIILSLKIFSLLTLIVPLVMLIGKVIYRSLNKNMFQKGPDSLNAGDIDQLSRHFIEALSPNIKGNEFSRLSNEVEKFCTVGYEDGSLLAKVTSLHTEISGSIRNLSAFISEYKIQGMQKNQFKAFHKALLELENRINAKIRNPELQDRLIELVNKQAAEQRVEFQKFQDHLADCRESTSTFRSQQTGLYQYEDLLNYAKEVKIFSTESLDNFATQLKILFEVLGSNTFSGDVRNLYDSICTSLKPVGIPNIGNSCYMNVVLQIFAHSPKMYLLLNKELNPADFLFQLYYEETENLKHHLKLFMVAYHTNDNSLIRLACVKLRERLFEMRMIQGIGTQETCTIVLELILDRLQFKKPKLCRIIQDERNGDFNDRNTSLLILDRQMAGEKKRLSLQTLLRSAFEPVYYPNDHIDENGNPYSTNKFYVFGKLPKIMNVELIDLRSARIRVDLPAGQLIDVPASRGNGASKKFLKYQPHASIKHQVYASKVAHTTSYITKCGHVYLCDDHDVVEVNKIDLNGAIWVVMGRISKTKKVN